MKCELTIKKSGAGNKVGRTRNNVSGRSKRRFDINLHNTLFQTKELGSFRVRIATSTKRTIDKYGGMVNFLCGIGENQLSPLGLSLKARILKYQSKIVK